MGKCEWDDEEKAWRHTRVLSNRTTIKSDDIFEEMGEKEDWYWHASDGTWRKGLETYAPELSYEDVLEMDEKQHLQDKLAAEVKELQSEILRLEDELEEMAPQVVD